MTVSTTGFEFIKRYETFVGTAYEDDGKWYVGYGNHYYKDSSTVKPSDSLTEAKANDLLKHWVGVYEKTINNLNVKLNQGQFDALVSYVYNRGPKAFFKSDLRKMVLKNPNNSKIPEQFVTEWGTRVDLEKGLKRRRYFEGLMYKGSGSQYAPGANNTQANSLFFLVLIIGFYLYYKKRK